MVVVRRGDLVLAQSVCMCSLDGQHGFHANDDLATTREPISPFKVMTAPKFNQVESFQETGDLSKARQLNEELVAVQNRAIGKWPC